MKKLIDNEVLHDEQSSFIRQLQDVINRAPLGVQSRERALEIMREKGWQTVRDIPAAEYEQFIIDVEKATKEKRIDG